MSAYTAKGLVKLAQGKEGAPQDVEDAVWLQAAQEVLADDDYEGASGRILAKAVVERVRNLELARANEAAEAAAAADRKAKEAAEAAAAAERKAKEEAEAAAAADRKAKEEAEAVSVYLLGGLIRKLGQDNPKSSSELIQTYTLIYNGWINSLAVRTANETPKKEQKVSTPPQSTGKDSAPSESAQSSKTGMHGFQLTTRVVYAWAEWELDIEELYFSLTSHLELGDGGLDEWVDAWVAGAKLLHVSRGTMTEEQQQHPLLGMWLKAVVAAVFDGSVEVVHEKTKVTTTEKEEEGGAKKDKSPNNVSVDVPVYKNDVWASRKKDGTTKDADESRHKRRGGWIDFIIRDSDGVIIMVIEVKQPVPTTHENRRSPHKGQVIVETAAVARNVPVFGLLTDMRYRVNTLMFVPSGEKKYVRRGMDVEEQYNYAPWTFAMTQARRSGDAAGSSTQASEVSDWAVEENDTRDVSGFDGERAKYAAKCALVGLAIALLPDWGDGQKARKAGSTAVGEELAALEATIPPCFLDGAGPSSQQGGSSPSADGDDPDGQDGGDDGGSASNGDDGDGQPDADGTSDPQGSSASTDGRRQDRAMKGKRKRAPLTQLAGPNTANTVTTAPITREEKARYWNYPDAATLAAVAPPMDPLDWIREWMTNNTAATATD